MMVSIIIPVFNAAPYLKSCLDSVCLQTLRDIEVICVDDGSTDGSGAVLSDYASQDRRITVLTQTNAGQGAARNRGLASARGDWVYFMDADDELCDSGALEYLVNEASRANMDMIVFDAKTVFDTENVRAFGNLRTNAYVRSRDYSQVRSGPRMLADMCKHGDYTASPVLALSRRDFLVKNEIRFLEGVIYEDNAFMLAVMLAAGRIAHRRRQLYLRHVRDNSTMTKPPSLRNVRGYLACYRFALEQCRRKDLPPFALGAVQGVAARMKWQTRHAALVLGFSKDNLPPKLDEGDRRILAEIMPYPLSERIASFFRCLRDNGLAYTFNRVLSRLSCGCRACARLHHNE